MRKLLTTFTALTLAAATAGAQINYDTVQVRTTALAPGVFMLVGAVVRT
jgi:hypothetical protein